MPRLAAAVPAERRVQALAAVQALLALSLSLDGGRHASVYNFVRALRQRVLSVRAPARDDAVQLLTVHGVKGLEARCVWVIDADPIEPREAKPGVLIDWPVADDAPRRAAFVADLASPCASLSDLRALEQAAAQREELNALYVAMTRARDMLLFSRTPPRRDDARTTWWTRTWPHTQAWLPESTQLAPHAATPAASVFVIELPKLQGQRASAPGPAPVNVVSRAASLGRAVHRVLQWSTAAPQAADFRALAIAAVAEFDLTPSAVEAVATYARTIRNSPALQRFFDPTQWTWSADEFDVVSDGESLRIDRLVRLGSEQQPQWWVLDYKLAFDAAADEGLRRQLTRYRNAVQAMTGGASVHAAFVTGDGALHELEPCGAPAE